jgi:NAD(P)H-hydrate epimerase
LKSLDKKTIKSLITPRVTSSHKGDHGHGLLIAGNKGRMGACVIAAKACLRCGAGLVSVNIPETERMILQTALPEAMVLMREQPMDLKLFSAAGIGPGLGTSAASKKLLKQMITQFQVPLLLDADALNIISEEKSLLKKITEQTILTPHPKEFDRLFGNHKNENDRAKKAIEMAARYDVVIVLKGAKTLVTYRGDAVKNSTGNAGLAKGGSGDALTGIVTAFLAQGYEPYTAAKIGVYLHGLAADIALQDESMESMLISDVIECIGSAFKKIVN